jgi:RHS repeat-associated protein
VKKTYASGQLDETRHFYYTEPSRWQVIEERIGSSMAADRQFAWGCRYIDDLVLRDRDTSADGLLDERLYGMQDTNWNVSSIASAGGVVQERYGYHPYGTPVVLTAEFGFRASSNSDWERLFAGYPRDRESKLYQVRYRYLNPCIGGWINRDELLPRLGSHRYTYAFGNAVNSIDPSGRVTIVEIIFIGIIVIVIFIVLTWVGCEITRTVRRTTRRRTTCRGNPKFEAAKSLLQQCGFGGDSSWAESNDGINVWCTEERGDEAVTLFAAPTTSGAMSTTLVVHCSFNAADVAMQIAGEFYRQNRLIVGDIANQTIRLNQLIDCLHNLGEIPSSPVWRHEEEDPGLIDPRR